MGHTLSEHHGTPTPRGPHHSSIPARDRSRHVLQAIWGMVAEFGGGWPTPGRGTQPEQKPWCDYAAWASPLINPRTCRRSGEWWRSSSSTVRGQCSSSTRSRPLRRSFSTLVPPPHTLLAPPPPPPYTPFHTFMHDFFKFRVQAVALSGNPQHPCPCAGNSPPHPPCRLPPVA